MTDELTEAVARIIDPSSWAVMDRYLEQTKRKYAGEHVGWPADQFQHRESMALATAAIAAVRAHDAAQGYRLVKGEPVASELEDDLLDLISDAIGESMDVDWTYRDGARHVLGALVIGGFIAINGGE